MPTDKQLVATGQEPIYLSKMAPAGVDGRVWTRVLKEQLLSSKNSEVTDEELLYFAQVSQSTQLDPSKREIYGIFRNVKQKDNTYKPKLSIQTGIDGFRVAAERSNKFGGSKEPEFIYDPEVVITVNAGGTQKVVPNRATVTVLKVMGDRVLETARSANWADYYPGDTEGMMWRKLPETMLSKVAEAQALRAAFPNCAQLYLEEEMAKPDDVPEAGTDMAKIRKAIDEAKTLDELLEIMEPLPVDVQKQLTPMTSDKAHAISAADDAKETPKKNAKPSKGVKNATPKK